MEVVEGVIWKHRRKKRALHEGWMEALLLFFFPRFYGKPPVRLTLSKQPLRVKAR